MKKAEYPTLFISCPICDSVFQKIALKEEFYPGIQLKYDLATQIIKLSEEGYIIRNGDKDDYRLEYCEHIKEKQNE